MWHWLKRWWLAGRAATPVTVSEAQWAAAEANLPLLDHLSDEERQSLRQLSAAFIAQKQWSAGGGLLLMPEIQLQIALQACVLVLHLGLERYGDWLGVIVYPGDFLIPRAVTDEMGIVHEYQDAVLGEAWAGGPVLISWFDVPEEAGGANSVIHEFAHKLDMTNGAADGVPELPAATRRAWQAAFQPAYEDFCRRVRIAELSGRETPLDPYAAEHPAEFFAVMSEAFFETPALLREEYPAVYEQLRGYYRQDTAPA